jgi:hypothetical protein
MLVGTPVEMKPDAPKTAVLRTVALGFTTGAEAPQLPAGVSSAGSNFLSAFGGLFPRPGLSTSLLSRTSQLVLTNGAGWVGEGLTGRGDRFPAILQANHPARFYNDSWSTLSQVGPAGLSANTLAGLSINAAFDAVTYYHPTSDEFELCFMRSGASGPWTWRADTTLFSTLTGAPQARYATVFDSRLVFSNVSSQGTEYPQRVQWSGRGLPETYTSPDGGFEELMDARGRITGIESDGDRLLVFFESEIWQGLKAPFPFTFQFLPLVRTVGTLAPWSIAQTPRGIVFLGNDRNLYLIPPGGSPSPIGEAVRRHLQDAIDPGEFAALPEVWISGLYDHERDGYWLIHPSVPGGQSSLKYPQGIFVSMGATPTWSPVGFTKPSAAAANQSWTIRRIGATSLTTASSSTSPNIQRVIVADSGFSQGGFNTGTNVFEFLSRATNDFGGTSSVVPIDCNRSLIIPNPDPTRRQVVREVRIDYRTPSASSMTLRMTPDFGTTYPVSTGLALPVAVLSAQTKIGVGMTAVYPVIDLQASSTGTFVIQGITAVVEDAGNG